MVKWVGYPEPTPEPQWKILRDTKDPTILEQMEQCKQDYLAKNPAERTMVEVERAEHVEPERIQPRRSRARTERFTFYVYGVADPPTHSRAVTGGMRALRDDVKRRCAARRQFVPDFSTICV